MTGAHFIDGEPAELYHAEPALSAGGALALLEECPAAYFHTSPFNPAPAKSDDKLEFDLGTALHLAALEGDEFDARTAIIEADDFKTKAAREARDAAYLEHKTPLLPKHLAVVRGMRDALLAHPDAADLLSAGVSEQSIFWTDPATGVPCKCRPDKFDRKRRLVIDLKTSVSAHPRAVQRSAFDHGWPLRHVWYADGVKAAHGIGLEDYWFVVVERAPPHLVACYRLDDSALAWGAKMADAARALFARCRAANRWPAYKGRTTLSLPGWAEFHLEDRRMAGEFEAKPSELAKATAAKMFEPI